MLSIAAVAVATVAVVAALTVGRPYLRYVKNMILGAPLLQPSVESSYPPSEILSGLDIDWSTRISLAPGSGDWGITWADDDHQYAPWGNGGGFGGTNADGRVYLGIVRIEGDKDNYTGFNVWGGKDAENPAQFGGKSFSMLSVDDTFYMWRCGDTELESAYQFQELYSSSNDSQTWEFTGVEFTQASFPGKDKGFVCPVFLQFGQDYTGARDEFIYMYAPEIKTDEWTIHQPGELTLMRVSRSGITDQSQYEYLHRLEENNKVVWTDSVSQRIPVFEDANGILHATASYNAGLGRYMLVVEHSEASKGNIGIYEAPEPWGPWRTVLYETSFGWPHVEPNTFMWVLPNKWLGADGREFVLIFTGKGELDSWNTVEGQFVTVLPGMGGN